MMKLKLTDNHRAATREQPGRASSPGQAGRRPQTPADFRQMAKRKFNEELPVLERTVAIRESGPALDMLREKEQVPFVQKVLSLRIENQAHAKEALLSEYVTDEWARRQLVEAMVGRHGRKRE